MPETGELESAIQRRERVCIPVQFEVRSTPRSASDEPHYLQNETAHPILAITIHTCQSSQELSKRDLAASCLIHVSQEL